MSDTPYKKQQLNTNIHGLRGLAAFTVYIYHIYLGAITAGEGHLSQGFNFWPTDFVHYVLGPILHSFNAGIEIFFMISGYLITSSLLHLQDVRRFAVNRCIRIYPTFLATQVLMFTVGPIIGWTWMSDLTFVSYFYHLAINLLFLPGVFPFEIALPAAWTLSYEAAFYIVAALLFVLTKQARRSLIILTISVIAIWLLFRFPVATFFVVGAMAYFVEQRVPQLARLTRFPLIPFVSFCLMLAGVELSFAKIDTLYYIFVNLFGFIAFLSITQGYGIVARLLRTRFFQFLGSISYSLYLWQVPVMFPIKRVLLMLLPAGTSPYIILYSFVVLSTIAVFMTAYISFRIFEVMIPRYLKTRLTNRQSMITSRS